MVVLYGGHVSVSSLSELDLHDDENIDFAIIDDEEINNNTSLDHLHETHSSTARCSLHQSDTSIPKSKAGKVSKISKPLTQTALLRVAGVELRITNTRYYMTTVMVSSQFQMNVYHKLKAVRYLLSMTIKLT